MRSESPFRRFTPPPGLSVVVPFHNEQENLCPLIEELVPVLRSFGRDFEILLVDDGSTDEGLRTARSLASTEPALRAIRLPRRSGQSAALAAGFSRARHELIVTMDADLQNDPRDIARLLEYSEDYDLVTGVRVDRQDNFVRRLSSRIANCVRNAVLRDGISDVGCSLKVMRTELRTDLPVFDGMHRFLPALLQMRGARVVEVPVGHRPRLHGLGKYGIRNRLWRGIVDLLAVRWLKARTLGSDRTEEIESWKRKRFG